MAKWSQYHGGESFDDEGIDDYDSSTVERKYAPNGVV